MDADYEIYRSNVVCVYCSKHPDIHAMIASMKSTYKTITKMYEEDNKVKFTEYIYLSPIRNLFEEYENLMITLEIRAMQLNIPRKIENDKELVITLRNKYTKLIFLKMILFIRKI